MHRCFIGRGLRGKSHADLEAGVRYTITVMAGEAFGAELLTLATDTLAAGAIVAVESDRRAACDRVQRQLVAWAGPAGNA